MVAKRSGIKNTSEDTLLLLPQKEFGTMLENEKNKSVLKLSQKIAYGVGHIMNDICCAMWFSYILLFFEVILEMPSALAGALVFLGQLADAIASPIIGMFIDRNGTRKSWHMLGTTLIAFSFSLIFSKCPWGPDSLSSGVNSTDGVYINSWNSSSVAEISFVVFYYSILVVIFQTGWATVQIAHLAIIPDMTPDKSGRADLTAIRYTATVCSSVFVYLVTWLILHVTEGKSSGLGSDDLYKFKDVVLIGLLIGGIFTMLFHAMLKPSNETENVQKNSQSSSDTSWLIVIRDYFKCRSIYQVTMVYFASKMVLNISLVYMPLYLVEKVGDNPEYIATVPLASYIASFLASLGVRQVRSTCDSKTSYVIGSLLCVGACVWIGIGLEYTAELFGVSVLLGAGSSITGVASLCLCAELIGTDTRNGAFVYSVVTSVDKLLGGVVVIVIENFKNIVFDQSSHYYQDVLAYGCGISTILGLMAVTTMYFSSEKILITNSLEDTSIESVQS